jgi:hypothetical protein
MTAPVRQPSPPGAPAPDRPEPRRRWTRRRHPSGALARIEARHLARSPLLWTGFGLALALLTVSQLPFMSWPVLAGDDLFGYQTGYLLSGGALLAGAWLGLRDRATGAADLVAVTPTAPWRLQRTRLASVAAVTAGAFAVAFAAALAVSAVRGGRGTPDLRLLADGALAVVLGGWVGVAVGRLSGSRMVSVLAAPVWVAGCLFAGTWPEFFAGEPPLAVQRLAPLLFVQEERSAEFGFLPDPLWPHLGYLLGLVLLVGIGLLTLAARGSGQGPSVAPVVATVMAGVVLVTAGGVGVVTLPHRLVVLGPDRADWRPLSQVTAESGDRPWSYPDDGHARACAGDATLTACVYPAYGQGLAHVVRDAVAPVAVLFAGLPGVPTRVRMVPSQDSSSSHSACRGSEAQFGEPEARALSRDDRDGRFHYIDVYLRCALGEYNWGVGVDDHQGDQPPSEALDTVKLWALLVSGNVTGEELRRAWAQDGHPNPIPIVLPTLSPEVVAAADAMAALPADQVRAELAPVWDRLRAGILPVSELPGQRP